MCATSICQRRWPKRRSCGAVHLRAERRFVRARNYIATTAGWWTAELGRQPWLIHGLLRTADGGSSSVHAGNVVFTLLGFAGLYLVLGILFLYMVFREIAYGPKPTTPKL
jgi:cytochrome bd-type quinol oxidase subunit 1